MRQPWLLRDLEEMSKDCVSRLSHLKYDGLSFNLQLLHCLVVKQVFIHQFLSFSTYFYFSPWNYEGMGALDESVICYN